jgi:hypothetical protein
MGLAAYNPSLAGTGSGGQSPSRQRGCPVPDSVIVSPVTDRRPAVSGHEMHQARAGPALTDSRDLTFM